MTRPGSIFKASVNSPRTRSRVDRYKDTKLKRVADHLIQSEIEALSRWIMRNEPTAGCRLLLVEQNQNTSSVIPVHNGWCSYISTVHQHDAAPLRLSGWRHRTLSCSDSPGCYRTCVCEDHVLLIHVPIDSVNSERASSWGQEGCSWFMVSWPQSVWVAELERSFATSFPVRLI